MPNIVKLQGEEKMITSCVCVFDRIEKERGLKQIREDWYELYNITSFFPLTNVKGKKR